MNCSKDNKDSSESMNFSVELDRRLQFFLREEGIIFQKQQMARLMVQDQLRLKTLIRKFKEVKSYKQKFESELMIS
jgi:transposase InsO family protein